MVMYQNLVDWHSLELNSLWLLIYWPDLCQLPHRKLN